MWLVSPNGEGNGTPLQYSWLENPMDGGAWWAAVHGVTKGRTRLSNFTFTFHFHALEKEMATHPSVLAWRIPGTGEPGGLPSMGSHRVGHDWSDSAAAVSPKGNQPWIFIGRTDAEAEGPVLWSPDAKSWLIGKAPDAGKDGRQEEKGTTEDEMVRWHHWLDGYEFEQTPQGGEGQGSLVCCIHGVSKSQMWLNDVTTGK